MGKRPHPEPHGSSHKKPKTQQGGPTASKKKQPQSHDSSGHRRSRANAAQVPTHENAAQVPNHVNAAQVPTQLPPASTPKSSVPGYYEFKVPGSFPTIPPLAPEYTQAPFRHKSGHGYDRSSTASDMTYERLEFLGDAYLELVASRLIYHHFAHLTAGNQSQLRELLVKNETLAEYARAYNFEDRLGLADKDRLQNDAKNRGNKGLNKILGDVFEAYVAALVLGNPEDGFALAEKWLTSLWTPKLIKAAKAYHQSVPDLVAGEQADPLKLYNPTARADLQRRIYNTDVRLQYVPYRESVELKGDKIGQNTHYIAVYLTGYGFERKWLGQGEGKNKVEAGNWAATQAMHGECKEVVDECERQLLASRELKKKEKAEKAMQAASEKADKETGGTRDDAVDDKSVF